MLIDRENFDKLATITQICQIFTTVHVCGVSIMYRGAFYALVCTEK